MTGHILIDIESLVVEVKTTAESFGFSNHHTTANQPAAYVFPALAHPVQAINLVSVSPRIVWNSLSQRDLINISAQGFQDMPGNQNRHSSLK